MKKIYAMIRNYALKKKNKDGLCGTTIQWLFHLFSNNFFQAFVTIIGTVGIGLMMAFQYFGVMLYILIGIYVLSILLMAWADTYLREQLVESRNLTQALQGINVELRQWAMVLQELAKKIRQLPKKNRRQFLEQILNDFNVQKAAIDVCQNLHQHLTKYCKNENIYITIFQKQVVNNETTCRMIAHSENYTPNSYDTVYPIPSKSEAIMGQVEYHSYIFAKNITTINILSNQTRVQSIFKMHEDSIEREQNIQQYIGVPISITKQGVTLLLQIDTNQQGLFGENEIAVRNFANLAIYPYAQFLHLVYEEYRVISELIKE